jgi:TonB family protein
MCESSPVYTPTDVEVEVRIDDGGRVAEAHVLKNGSNENKLLTNAALAAAKEWIFEPAKVNGKNVPSDHAIEFHFRPQLPPQ